MRLIPSQSGLLCAIALAGVSASCDGCKDETETGDGLIPVPRGGATTDVLSTDIGQARGLDPRIAPTSTTWTQVFVVDERRAFVVGEATGKAVALGTNDAGATWRSIQVERGPWTGWAAGTDGSLFIATGTRAEPKSKLPEGTFPPIDSVRVHFVPENDDKAGAPSTLFEPVDAGPGALVKFEAANPGFVTPTRIAFVGELRNIQSLLFAAPLGAQLPPATPIPRGERPVGAFYGRPAQMLSVRGGKLVMRPVPEPETPLAQPTPIEGVAPTKAIEEQLSRPPRCETGAWSFQLLERAAGKLMVLGVAPKKSVVVPLPENVLASTPLGCGHDRLVVETIDPSTARRHPTVCTLEGECVVAKNPPFREYEDFDRHEQWVATEKGAIGAIAVKSPSRWGMFVTQSENGGEVFDVQRAVGEGEGDLGRMELGALLQMGSRTVLLLSASITGRTARGWFVIATDDGGATWEPPS